MVGTSLGDPPNSRGSSTLIPLVLGVTGGTCTLVVTAVECHLRSTDRDIPCRSPGVEQVGVLDGNRLAFVATGE